MPLILPYFGAGKHGRFWSRVLQQRLERGQTRRRELAGRRAEADAQRGGATTVWISGENRERAISLVVRDNGRGFDTRRILNDMPDSRIIILTAFADSADVGRAIACGARGLTTSDISVQLGISQSGIKQHIAHICEKLGAANRSEAAAIAIRRQMIKM